MIRNLIGTMASVFAAGLVGVGLFFVKHEVKEQEVRLSELNREIQTNQEAIHVLKAEWSFLNDPTRLKQLSEKYLDMRVMGPGQVTTLQALAPELNRNSAVAAAPRPPAARPTQQSLAETKPKLGDMR